MQLSPAVLPLSSLKLPNDRARRHSTRQRKKAKHIFANQGIIVPIIVNTSHRIIDGVLRFEVAQDLGLEHLHAIVVHTPCPSELTQLELSLNRLAEDSKWDPDVLKFKIEQLIDFQVDLTLTGFETAEIDNILAFEIIDEGDQNWTTSTPITRHGDIWSIGNHLIACGDALKSHEVLDGIVDKISLAKACITDPPYNVPTRGHIRTHGYHSEFAIAAGEMDDEAFVKFLYQAMKNALAYTTNEALFYLFMDWRHLSHLSLAAKQNDLIQQNLCVWSKTNAGMGSFYRSQHELIGVYSRSKTFQNNIQLGSTGRYRSNVWVYDGVNSFSATRSEDLQDHPTVKPTQLIADIILDCTSLRDWVFDPFLGSGTTCLAAEQTQRRCLGIEYEPRYVDRAIKRLKDRCGLNATHLASGKSFGEITDERSKITEVVA